jgi:hypothetical protein
MRTPNSALVVFLVLSMGLAAPALAQSPEPVLPLVRRADIPPPHADVAAESVAGPRSWIGRQAEIAEYLRIAAIERTEQIPVGVTKPRKAFFAAGGLVHAAAVKWLPAGRRNGFWESHKSEIAAYELDRLLGLDMVPVTIERRVGSDSAAVQLWVEDCRLLRAVDQSACPRPADWAKQVCRQRVFDDLIANVDRNAGNLLIDPEWNLILIDHSRAFASNSMPFEKQALRIDRELFARLKALDRAALDRHVRPWVLSDGSIRDLLKRRDKIVARFERLARERGEALVFPW